MVEENWFVLSPVQEFYFRQKNLSYKTLPPFHESCHQELATSSMELIYPKPRSRIFVPRELDGSPGRVVFEVAHHSPGITLYWHLDGNYVGSTRNLHQLSFQPLSGDHTLVLVDESGESLKRNFEVISGK
jgi:penicillin-binding protein 1C